MAKKKYDVVIGNPPYSRNMHLDFLADGINNLKPNGEGVFIHPATWALNEVPGNAVKKYVDTLDQHIVSLDVCRGIFEKANVRTDLSITKFSSKNVGSILVNDPVNNNFQYEVDSLTQVSKWGNSQIYNEIKSLINRKIINTKSLADVVKTKASVLNRSSDFFFPLHGLVGTFGDKGGYKRDFFIFWAKKGSANRVFSKGEIGKEWTNTFEFKTKKEAQNFQKYLKTYIARFCLGICKFDRHISKITLQTTPWLDFSEEWDDKKLATYLGLSQKHLKFIADRIPAYYDDVEPLV